MRDLKGLKRTLPIAGNTALKSREDSDLDYTGEGSSDPFLDIHPTKTRADLNRERRLDRARLLAWLYRNGVSAADCGIAVGVSKQRVLQLLRAAGVERRHCGNPYRGRGGRYAGVVDDSTVDSTEVEG